MSINEAIRKFVYGDPLVVSVNPRILALYNAAVSVNGAILLDNLPDYNLMICEFGYAPNMLKRTNNDGSSVLGTFLPQTVTTTAPDGAHRVPVLTTLKFEQPPPAHATHAQIEAILALTCTRVDYIGGERVIHYCGGGIMSIDGNRIVTSSFWEIIEVPDGQQDIDDTLPINEVNGIRRRQ